MLHLGDALWCAHALDVLRGAVDKDPSGEDQRLQALPVQVDFFCVRPSFLAELAKAYKNIPQMEYKE